MTRPGRSSASGPPRPVRVRDGQRSRVYEAEHLVQRIFDRAVDHPVVQVAGSTVVLPPERHFGDLDGVQRYVDAVLRQAWVRARWSRAAVPVSVRSRAGTDGAHYERAGAVIAVPVHRPGRWALRELVVLHELAHHLAPDDPEAGHGPAFTHRFVELVDGTVGPEAALLLRVTYADVGVRVG
ncbi:TIGR04338 family metallohydrolase [Nakamurella flava]|uniref:TIGR04338 family metallohydrolase n=1 Tax=Nakamurella flava TaxID=2576308 RepID=A0A4U6QAK6_9ACTN|nr:TIGR04338 family metallohydrolase [Nakamurella flava]TKV56922.1 TIGR04338 family metallohydrolase [Nakamurella flava]